MTDSIRQSLQDRMYLGFEEAVVKDPPIRSFSPIGAVRPSSLLLMNSSLVLLLLTCVQVPIVQKLATLLWLISLSILAMINLGGTLGVYVASLALHGALSRRTLSGLIEHPDNLGLVIVMAAMVMAVFRRRQRDMDGRITLLVVVFIVYGLANIVFLGDPTSEKFFKFLRTFIIPFVFFVLVCRASLTWQEMHDFLWAIVLLGAYSSLVSILEQLEWNQLIFPTWLTDPEVNGTLRTNRSGGLLMQYGWNGLLLNLALFVVLYGKRLRVLKIAREIQVVLGAVLLVAIFFTYSRGVWLGTLLLLVAFFWTSTSAGESSKNSGLRRLLFACAIVVGVTMAVFVPSRTAAERMGNVDTIEFRFDLWRVAINMVSDRPLTGHGFFAYTDKAADYYLDNLEAVPRAALVSGHTSSHNTTLQILAELGLIGLFLYAAIILFMYKTAANRIQRLWGAKGKWMVAVFLLVYLTKIQFGVATEATTNTATFSLLGAMAGMLGAKVVAKKSDKALNARKRRGPLYA